MLKIAVLSAAAGALLAFALSPACLRWLHGLLASRSPPLPEDAVADVAIVLGYALFRDGSPTQPLKGRVAAGVDLLLRGRARHLLFSGAHPGGVVARRSEANVMRELAEELFMTNNQTNRNRHRTDCTDPDDDDGNVEWKKVQDRLYEEDASTSTYENALFSLDICRQHGWTTLLVVTSPFHQVRSELVFRRLVNTVASSHGAAAGAASSSTAGGTDWGLPTIKVYMARTAFVPHSGYFLPVFDRIVDLWDWARELLALVYYFAKDRI
ncbi:hypothetical protein Agub_g8976 [Astrephomene gubernaculifera]|uniref:DUF218 domain-containing protein n=1 Tax=Astrephomene gubernaculifera TaxID=47775 RepID=A0AAD3DUE8_9CHLO|nr:hypothetical protein Agub_g8976 [Astrephomene gubernaculifera]